MAIPCISNQTRKQKALEVIREVSKTLATSLDLSYCQLTTLPAEILEVPHLKELKLNGNPLGSLPEQLFQLPCLEVLDISSAGLTEISPRISELSKLRSICFGNNNIVTLPAELFELSQLVSLSLWGNELEPIPDQIGKLASMEELNLSHTGLCLIPEAVYFLPSLRKLSLTNNRISELNPKLSEFHNLRELWLNNNRIRDLPAYFFNFAGLDCLSFGDNQLKTLHPLIGTLQGLTFLDLRGNLLRTLPDELFELVNLRTLLLQRNEITNLSEKVSNLQALNDLEIDNNSLSLLPSSLSKLSNLTCLDIHNNPLTSLPDGIAELKKLETFNLSCTNLESIPRCLHSLPALKHVNIDGVPWRFQDNDLAEPPFGLKLPNFTICSNPASIAATRISLLAIAETLLAMSLAVGISIATNDMAWLAAVVLITPLILLGSSDSVSWGVRMLRKYSVITNLGIIALITAAVIFWFSLGVKGLIFGLLMPGIFFSTAITIFFLLLRVAATARSLVRHPLKCISVIPHNWKQAVLCTDFFTPPGFFPGWYHKFGDLELQGELKRSQWSPFGTSPNALFRKSFEWSPWHLWKGEYFGSFLQGSLLHQYVSYSMVASLILTSSVYRLAVKSTCIAYLPIIWIIKKGSISASDLYLKIEDCLIDDLQRVRLWVSIFVIFAFVGKLIYMQNFEDSMLVWKSTDSWRLLGLFVVPEKIPIWQVASFINSLLAIAVFYTGRKLLRLHRTGRSPSEATVHFGWRSYAVLSSVLSLYTVTCTVIIIIKEQQIADFAARIWKAFGTQLFP